MHKAAIVVLIFGLFVILAAVFAIIRRAWVNKQLNSAAKVYQQAQQQATQKGQGVYRNVRDELCKADDFVKTEEQAVKGLGSEAKKLLCFLFVILVLPLVQGCHQVKHTGVVTLVHWEGNRVEYLRDNGELQIMEVTDAKPWPVMGTKVDLYYLDGRHGATIVKAVLPDFKAQR